MKERQPCIYKITNIKNKKVYIGQTNTTYHIRIRDHKWNLMKGTHSNEHLQNAWNKYGHNNFYFELLQECDTSELDELEKFWIELYDATNKKFGYNYEKGGNQRKVVHQLTRIKMSKLAKERAKSKTYRKEMSNRVKKLWQEGKYREKVKRTRETSRNFICLETMKVYGSANEIAEDLKVNVKSIYNNCIGKQKFVINQYGFRFQVAYYEEDKHYKKFEYKHHNAKSVICLNTGEVFDSAHKAGQMMNVEYKNISAACNGKLKSAGKDANGKKLMWEFYNQHLSI